MKIMQGDEFDLYINLKQDGAVLKPNLIDDLEICIGPNIRKTYLNGEVLFDYKQLKWYLRLTQQDTLGMSVGQYENIARIKYRGAPYSDVLGIKLESISVTATTSKEVL